MALTTGGFWHAQRTHPAALVAMGDAPGAAPSPIQLTQLLVWLALGLVWLAQLRIGKKKST
eukprot:1153131-Amphidinium_carterae.1